MFLQKDTRAALGVLKKMEDANVKSDSQTFSYLLGNCTTGDDISKVRGFISQFSIPM